MRLTRAGLAILVAVAALSGSAQAQSEGDGTEVSGSITGSVSWPASGSPYRVVGPLTIEPESSLSIGKGSTVIFSEGIDAPLVVRGRLAASGTPQLPITISCEAAYPGCWPGIEVFVSEIPEALRIDHGTVEFAEAAVVLHPGVNGYVSDSAIRFNGDGLAVTPSSQVDRNLVYGNEGFGVGDPGLDFKQTLVTDNGGPGVVLSEAAYTDTSPGFHGNTIVDNGAELSSPVALHATAEGEPWSVDATDNYWGTGDADVIARSIVDGNDEAGNSASVTFEPFRPSAHAQVPALPSRSRWSNLRARLPRAIDKGARLRVRPRVSNRTFRDCTDDAARASFSVHARPLGGGPSLRIGGGDLSTGSIRTERLRKSARVTVRFRHEVWYCRDSVTDRVRVRPDSA